MIQVFTICSNNYLAQAKTLADSVLRHNPDYRVTICLCDRKNDALDYSVLAPHEVLEVTETGIAAFDDMRKKYDIVELNTAIKPFVFQFLFRRDAAADAVFYLDPDTAVFAPLSGVEKALENADILLTPHILTPLEFDGKTPTENYFTNYGIYNLGFLALKRSGNAEKLLDWWARRLAVNCFIRPAQGIFVDQLPMEYVPLFFEGVAISRDMGLNMGPWNLHERVLHCAGEGHYTVNGGGTLSLYHFSNYNPLHPENPIPNYTRDEFGRQADLKIIYNWYNRELLANRYAEFSQFDCAYLKPATLRKRRMKRLRRKIKNFFRALFGMKRK